MKIKKGDTVYAKTMLGSAFNAVIIKTGYGIFGKKYLAEWIVNDIDMGIKYKTSGILWWWNII